MNVLRTAGIACMTLALAASSSFADAANFTKPIIVNKPVLKQLGGGIAAPVTYKFTLKSFKITDTRSVHEDTDFVSIAVAVGNNAPISLPTKSMGDLNNGTYTVNLTIPASVKPTDSVAFTYGIVNSGYNANSLEQALKTYVTSAAEAGAKAGIAAASNALLPGSGAISGSVGSSAADWAIGKLINIIFADCDGTVAAGSHVYSGAQLATQTAGGKTISMTDNNPGTDSPTGCGSNSHYYVTWSISQ